MIDLHNFSFAESMIDFIFDLDLIEDLYNHRSIEDISIAEYIKKYWYSEFENWYINHMA